MKSYHRIPVILFLLIANSNLLVGSGPQWATAPGIIIILSLNCQWIIVLSRPSLSILLIEHFARGFYLGQAFLCSAYTVGCPYLNELVHEVIFKLKVFIASRQINPIRKKCVNNCRLLHL